MQSIYNLSKEDLEKYFIGIGDKGYRATQIIEWLYRFEVRSFSEMTNQKKSIIAQLESDFNLDLLTLKERQISSDGTEKFLFELKDGHFIDTVLMNHVYGN